MPGYNQVLPSPQLGLAILPAEFVVALCLWLRIPVLSGTSLSFCSCHQLVDCFGEYIIGCGHGPLRIRHHNTLCKTTVKFVKNKECLVSLPVGLVMYFTQTFIRVTPHIDDISVRSALHSGVVTHSAFSSGLAALRGEMEKDAWHRGLFEDAGDAFPLVVDNFDVWIPLSIEMLYFIAQSSTVHSGLPVSTAFHHLVERLNVSSIYRYNAKNNDIVVLGFSSSHGR